MKFLCHLFVSLWFRFRAFNVESLKTPGPVLLIPNHVSWLDWLFLLAVLDEDWKFVTSATTARTSYVHRKMMVNRRTFPVDTASPYAAKRMAEFLATGGRLVLFAEGRITVTGSLMKLFDGTGFLIDRTGAKVITCYLRNARRTPFVRHTGWTRWRPANRPGDWSSTPPRTASRRDCGRRREAPRIRSTSSSFDVQFVRRQWDDNQLLED